jgi:hypothetical protein
MVVQFKLRQSGLFLGKLFDTSHLTLLHPPTTSKPASTMSDLPTAEAERSGQEPPERTAINQEPNQATPDQEGSGEYFLTPGG